MKSAITKSRSERRRFLTSSDPVLNIAVLLLAILGIILVYAATRDWFAANGQDPEYYLKRQIINVVIGIALAYGATLVITEYCVLTPRFFGG